MMNDKDKMHPEDMRNLMIFAVASLLIYFIYDSLVLAPKNQALKDAKQARAELLIKDPDLMNATFTPRNEAISELPRVAFENNAIKGSISLKGGQIDDLELREYFQTLEKKENVVLFSPKNVENTRYTDFGWVATEDKIRLPNANTIWRVDGNRKLSPEAPITLTWDNEQGLLFEREISIDKEYGFKIKQKVINNSSEAVTLHPYALILQRDIPKDYLNMWVAHEGPMGFIGDQLLQVDYAAMQKEPNQKVEANKGWIGISDKYWLTAIIPDQNMDAKYRFKYTPDAIKQERSRYQTDYTGAAFEIAPGSSSENTFHIYAGAKKVLTLEKYQKDLGVANLDYAVDFGWFWFFTKPFFFALHYLGLLVGNMGVAILLLTFGIRMAVFPLTNLSYKSFAKMKVVTPQITHLRETYGEDKHKLQEEIVKLYQKEGVNPMSGCLPMLVQIPIFFAFYKTILVTIEIRHAPFFGWIQDLAHRDPTSIFNLFDLLPYDVPVFLEIGVWPCIMCAAMLVQKRLNPPPQDKLQRDMMNIFPFFITFIMSKFASGLVIYWAFSAILSIMQQAYIMHSMGVPIYIFQKDKSEEALEKQVDKGPGVHPLAEMVEDEAEEALFGEGEQPKEITAPKPKKSKKKKK